MRATVLFYSICLFLLSACAEKELGPFVADGTKPAGLSNLIVVNDHGASTISYTLPHDPQLLYVEAAYTLSNGTTKSVKSSVFRNFIRLEGFVSTDEREVTLYTVNRAEMKSDPIQVRIQPLVSPLEMSYQSIKLVPDFGGVNVKYLNEVEHEYVLHFLIKDEEGKWQAYDKTYSSVKEPGFTFRGLDATPQDFGFYLVDKWQNRSDTLFENMTPLYEVEIDKSLMKHHQLDNDYYVLRFPTRPLSNLWNGPSTAAGSNFWLQEYTGMTFPWWCTIDLGKKYQIGRMKMFPVPALNSSGVPTYFFGNLSPRIFEIWGSNAPAPDGSWDSWTLLDRFESVKPSGLPIGQYTAEDLAVGHAGEEFTFSNYEQGYRYIRLNVLNSWSSQVGFVFQEMTLWGAPVE